MKLYEFHGINKKQPSPGVLCGNITLFGVAVESKPKPQLSLQNFILIYSSSSLVYFNFPDASILDNCMPIYIAKHGLA